MVLQHRLATTALGVLEEASEHPPVVLALLQWLLGGKGVLAAAALARHHHLSPHMTLLFLAPLAQRCDSELIGMHFVALPPSSQQA
jgi:hypothetical protein